MLKIWPKNCEYVKKDLESACRVNDVVPTSKNHDKKFDGFLAIIAKKDHVADADWAADIASTPGHVSAADWPKCHAALTGLLTGRSIGGAEITSEAVN